MKLKRLVELCTAILDLANQTGIETRRTNGPVAHLRLFVLSKFIVTILKTKIYGYGSRHSLKSLWSL